MIPLIVALLIHHRSPQTKPQVMVLGTYHFANPGRDVVKFKIRDTMSPKRQREIEDLVNRIARFHPTKIALEALPDSPKLDKNFDAYRRSQYLLTADETEQLGFRVAKREGLRQLYKVDYRVDLDFEKLQKFAETNHQQWFLDMMRDAPSKIGKQLEELDQRFTVSQILAILNSPAALNFNHSFYIGFLRLASQDEHPGAEVVGTWYQRNMAIYGNIRRVIDSPTDRVLVIFGAGHAKLLNEFLKESGDVEVVAPSRYLPPAPAFNFNK